MTKYLWADRALNEASGTQFGSILACALNVHRTATPRFVGKAVVTSDGFVTCNFVDRHGTGHLGAFVGAEADLKSNAARLAAFLELPPDQVAELHKVLREWVAVSYAEAG